MAANSGLTEIEAREREAEEARARLAKTLDTLTRPETQEAVKAEVLGHVQGYKDEILKKADSYKEQALQKARDAGRQTMQNVVDDLKTRAMNNPAAVALIGAGIGWRLYKHPPITTVLVGAGAALLMRTPGRSVPDDRRSYRDPYREDQPRGYVPGGVAGYGYPVEESAPGSSTTEQMMAKASDLGEKARDAGTRVREAAVEAGTQALDSAERARSVASDAAGDALEAAGTLVRTVRQNPLLMALAGLAAGVAVARSVRATETGDRLVRGGTDMVGRGARGVTSRIGGAASQVVEGASGLASAAASRVGDVAETVRTRVPDITSGITEAGGRAAASVSGLAASDAPDERPRASSGPRQGRARTTARQNARSRQPRVAERASREIVEMAERYPLLLSSLGLVIGAAAGAVMRPTEAEDRYIGRASDALKRRAQETVAEQLDQAVGAADEMIASFESRSGASDQGRGTGPADPGAMQPDLPGIAPTAGTDRTSVVVERAEDAAAARAALGGKDPAL